MRLEQLKYLVCVAEYMSFSKASESLFLSSQALNRSMTNLEQELGIVIFERLPIGVHITPEGKEIVNMAKEMLHVYDTTLKKIHNDLENEPKTIVLYANDAHTQSFFKDVILKYRQSTAHTKVKFLLRDFNIISASQINQMSKDQNNQWVGFMSAFGTQNFDWVDNLIRNVQYITDDSFTTKHVVCVSKDNILSQQKTVSLKMLQDSSFVRFSHPDTAGETMDFLDVYFKGQDIETSIAVHDLYSWIEVIAADQGIGIIDSMVCGKLSKCKDWFDRVSVLKLSDSVDVQHAFVCSPDCSKEVSDFIAFATEELKKIL